MSTCDWKPRERVELRAPPPLHSRQVFPTVGPLEDGMGTAAPGAALW